MKTIIAVMMAVLGLADLALSTALPPADTPEVAAAKAEHFARYNYEALRNSLGWAAPAYYSAPNYYYNAPQLAYGAPLYYGPALVTIQGRSLEPDEIGVAKTAQQPEEAEASSQNPSGSPASSVPVPTTGQKSLSDSQEAAHEHLARGVV